MSSPSVHQPRNPFQKVAREHQGSKSCSSIPDFSLSPENLPGFSLPNFAKAKTPLTPKPFFSRKETSEKKLFSGSNIVSDAAANFAAKNLNAGISSISSVVSRVLFGPHIQQYFDVDSAYVSSKIGFLVFPFEILKNESEDAKPFLRDDAKIDLYVPLMALFSFVMHTTMCAIYDGRTNGPLDMVRLLSQCLTITMIESFLLKISCALTLRISSSIFEIAAVASYKYVGLLFYRLLLGLFARHFLLLWAWRLLSLLSFVKSNVGLSD